MSENPVAIYGQIPAPYPPKDHWEYNLYEHLKNQEDQAAYEIIKRTPAMATAGYWADWCRAIFYAGTTMHQWNEATELRASFLAACALEERQSVCLISKYAAESGLGPAIKSVIGKAGRLAVEEIGHKAIEAISRSGAQAGAELKWDFDCLDSVPNRSLDRLILFGVASHVANWPELAKQAGRVLHDGGRLVIAEAPLGGKEFVNATHEDSHFEGFILRVLSGMGLKEDQLPSVSTGDLESIFREQLHWSRSFNWNGIYLFYGQKGGKDGGPSLKPAACTREVQAFLSPREHETLWDAMTESEKAVWGPTAAAINTPNPAASITWGGGNLIWAWKNTRSMTDIMWGNLMVKPGDKVLMICELPEDLGTLEELQKRVGPAGEIVNANMSPSTKGYNYKDWQERRKMYMGQGAPEEWPYDFADDYPDNYFDLIFIPQGVHHSSNWLRDAPRLVRALKPGHQVMAIECGINRPQMSAAREISSLARIVGDRVFGICLPTWLVGPLSPRGPLPPGSGYEHEGRPFHDVSAGHLCEAFAGSVTDVCSLEHKGWILFWGYKK